MKIFDAVAHPDGDALLLFEHDFGAKTTRVRILDAELHELECRHVEGLPRYPEPGASGVVLFAMPVRQYGEPVLMQHYGWTMDLEQEHEIRRHRLGMMRARHDRVSGLTLLDRQFPNVGELGVALVLDAERNDLGTIQIRSNLVGCAFTPDGSRIALLHTDQGGAEVQVHDIGPDGVSHAFDLQQKQVTWDSSVGWLEFHDDEWLFASVSTYGGSVRVGAYSARDGAKRFETKLSDDIDESSLKVDGETFDMTLFNGRTRCALREGSLWVGVDGGVVPVDVGNGEVGAKVAAPTSGLVVQVHELGETLVAVNVYGEVALVGA